MISRDCTDTQDCLLILGPFDCNSRDVCFESTDLLSLTCKTPAERRYARQWSEIHIEFDLQPMN